MEYFFGMLTSSMENVGSGKWEVGSGKWEVEEWEMTGRRDMG